MSFLAYLVRSNIVVDAYATFACGALAGAIAATLTTPADVAKTFRQIELGRTKYSSNNVCTTCSSTSIPPSVQSTKTLSILLHILRAEGPQGLFAGSYFFHHRMTYSYRYYLGLVPRLLKVAPGMRLIDSIIHTILLILACAIMITSFETLKRFFQRKNASG